MAVTMTDQPNDIPDFEKALAELESLVEKLESGELALDESLASFKRGVELTRKCQGMLDQAQQTVEKLLDAGDEESAEPFQADD
jgi:exodeoxyribonuclease VII small subunit